MISAEQSIGTALCFWVARLWRKTWLNVFLSIAMTPAFALDLSLPKDEVDRPELGQETTHHSPVIALYVDNVKETIKNRLRDGFPRDSAGQVICGEAAYTMLLAADGSISHLEVNPVRQDVDNSSELESYYVQPSPAQRYAGSAKLTRPVATDKSDREQFARTLAELLRNVAPFPAPPESGISRHGRTYVPGGTSLIRVDGHVGVRCRRWEVGS